MLVLIHKSKNISGFVDFFFFNILRSDHWKKNNFNELSIIDYINLRNTSTDIVTNIVN